LGQPSRRFLLIPGAWGRRLDRLSSRGPPAAFLGHREFDGGRLYRRNDADGMLHGDRDVSCDADDKGDSPADRHAWLVAARHEPTVDEAIGYHDRLDVCVHIVTPRAHVTGSSELGPPTSEPLCRKWHNTQTRALVFYRRELEMIVGAPQSPGWFPGRVFDPSNDQSRSVCLSPKAEPHPSSAGTI
jgi:hypothetical protein